MSVRTVVNVLVASLDRFCAVPFVGTLTKLMAFAAQNISLELCIISTSIVNATLQEMKKVNVSGGHKPSLVLALGMSHLYLQKHRNQLRVAMTRFT